MQNFALFVTKSPYDSRNSESAHAFCLAALALGHCIKHVFFYQSGIHNASALLEVNSDEVSMRSQWHQFSKTHKVPLYVCVTAATRRGIVGAEGSETSGIVNASSDFEVVGMSEYFAALHDASIKSVQF